MSINFFSSILGSEAEEMSQILNREWHLGAAYEIYEPGTVTIMRGKSGGLFFVLSSHKIIKFDIYIYIYISLPRRRISFWGTSKEVENIRIEWLLNPQPQLFLSQYWTQAIRVWLIKPTQCHNPLHWKCSWIWWREQWAKSKIGSPIELSNTCYNQFQNRLLGRTKLERLILCRV